jgi:YVTN family beta-propeller protein
MEPLHPDDPPRVGPYELLGRLGAGGMGQVYLGRDAAGTHAAVKVVHPGHAADPDFRRRFAREVATAQRVVSPWTVPVLGADPQAGRPWLATGHVAGPDLDHHVATSGPLAEPAATVLAGRLAHALAHLHAAGVVHRDLKPSNVLLAEDGPRLIDFGIARAVDATSITHTGVVLGTPAFMSPEQSLGEETGPPGDVFSLAAVITYAATGTGPFGQTENPMAMLLRISDDEPDLERLPAELRRHLEPCFAKDPALRPTAAELAATLDGPATAAAEALGLPPADRTVITAPPDAAGTPTLTAAPGEVPPFPGPLRSGPAAAPAPARRPLTLPLSLLAALTVLAVALAVVLAVRPHEDPVAAPAATQAGAGPVVDWPEPARPAGTGTKIGTVRVGLGPGDVVVAPDSTRAYSVNSTDVSVIDAASGTVTATIGLTGGPTGLVLTPDGTRAYVPLISGFVAVVDTATNTQVAAVPVPSSAGSAAITPDGRAVYVGHGDESGVAVSVIDTATTSVVATVPVSGPDSQQLGLPRVTVAAAPDSRSVWVGGEANAVSLIDTTSRTVIGTIPFEGVEQFTFAPDGTRVYAVARDEIAVFDPARRAKLGEIRRNFGALRDVAAAPNGRYLYAVVAGQAHSLHVIDSATGLVVHEIALETDAWSSSSTVAPDGRTVYVASARTDSVVVIDTSPYS